LRESNGNTGNQSTVKGMFVIVTATTGFTGNDILNLTLGSYDFADNVINNYVNSNPSSSAKYVQVIGTLILSNLLLLT
jgi:hypothetical protein